MRLLSVLRSAGRQGLGLPYRNAPQYGWLALRPVSQACSHREVEQPLQGEQQQALASASSSTNSSERTFQHRPPGSSRHKKHYSCPACGQRCYRVEVLQRHLLNCCPDLIHAELDLTFRQRDSYGQPMRQEINVVAAELGVPLARAQRLLQFAMRAVPLAADDHPVEVIYEDEDLVAVNKPPGVITAPKHRYVGGSIVNRIIGTLGFEPLVLHRLDMNTSGVVLFAKTRDVVPGLHAQFRNKEVRKEYLALSVGAPAESQFTVDAPIDRDNREKIARRVAPTGKPALTNFRVVATSPGADLSPGTAAALAASPQSFPPRGASLVQCEPLTGRTHQIRVHLAHRGHPILGDDVYGLVGPWIDRQALHAACLTVRHPRSGQPLRIEAPLPEDMLLAMRTLGLLERGS